MKISEETIESAYHFGQWLNKSAYLAAVEAMKKDEQVTHKQDIYKLKSKFLTELESSAYSSKTSTALIGQIITRAGRLTGKDAPYESKLFINDVLASNLGETEKESLENARHMIIAFSRLFSPKTEEVLKEQSIEFEKDNQTNDEEEISEDDKE